MIRELLQQALAQPEAEPVAWMRECWDPDCGTYTEIYTEAEMTWRDRKEWTPLYATPPAHAVPDPAMGNPISPMKPLTNMQLFDLLVSVDPTSKRLPQGFMGFARAVERAHGITGDSNG